MKNLCINEKNVSVTMTYDELQRLMKECVTTTIREVRNEQKKSEDQKWLDTTHTAKKFGVHVSTINRWKHSGYLTPRTVGGRDFFSIEDINSFVATNQRGA